MWLRDFGVRGLSVAVLFYLNTEALSACRKPLCLCNDNGFTRFDASRHILENRPKRFFLLFVVGLDSLFSLVLTAFLFSSISLL